MFGFSWWSFDFFILCGLCFGFSSGSFGNGLMSTGKLTWTKKEVKIKIDGKVGEWVGKAMFVGHLGF